MQIQSKIKVRNVLDACQSAQGKLDFLESILDEVIINHGVYFKIRHDLKDAKGRLISIKQRLKEIQRRSGENETQESIT